MNKHKHSGSFKACRTYIESKSPNWFIISRGWKNKMTSYKIYIIYIEVFLWIKSKRWYFQKLMVQTKAFLGAKPYGSSGYSWSLDTLYSNNKKGKLTSSKIGQV